MSWCVTSSERFNVCLSDLSKFGVSQTQYWKFFLQQDKKCRTSNKNEKAHNQERELNKKNENVEPRTNNSQYTRKIKILKFLKINWKRLNINKADGSINPFVFFMFVLYLNTWKFINSGQRAELLYCPYCL